MPNTDSLSVTPCLCERKTTPINTSTQLMVVFLAMLGLSSSSRSAASHLERGAV